MPPPPPWAPPPGLTPLAQGKEWLRQALERAGAGAAAAAGGVKRPRDEPSPELPVGPRPSAAQGAPGGTGSLDSGSDSDDAVNEYATHALRGPRQTAAIGGFRGSEFTRSRQPIVPEDEDESDGSEDEGVAFESRVCVCVCVCACGDVDDEMMTTDSTSAM